MAVALIFLAVGCSDDSTTPPQDTTTLIRLLNVAYDDTSGLDLYVAGTKVSSRVRAGKSGGYVKALTNGDSVPVGIHFADSAKARISSLQRMYSGGSFSVYAFPPIKTFSVSFADDQRTTSPGKARLKLVNGCSDGGQLSVAYTDETSTLLGPLRYTYISGYADVESGSHALSVLQLGNSAFEIAYDSVRLDPNGAYTLVLTGTLSDADQWGFIARLYNDNGDGTTYQDLSVAPDRGKVQMVHAVPGAAPFSVFLDGSTTATINNLTYPLQTPYVELATGSHTATVKVNGSAVISDKTFSILKRGRSTIFASGSLVPPNLSLLELVDLKKPLTPNNASLRVVNLSPDSPSLDGYFVTPTGDTKISECQDLSFRETSFSPSLNGQFFNLFPNSYTMVFKKAGTTEVVAGPTSISLMAGKIVTVWVGGLKSTAKIYTVTHN
ncbi:MAG: DUF4397 domain-containing protein [Candidatus Kapabacteria bacterium]|nr:DUF4397 domain-containing protein [Candidatus Kapabacteria bacterium]